MATPVSYSMKRLTLEEMQGSFEVPTEFWAKHMRDKIRKDSEEAREAFHACLLEFFNKYEAWQPSNIPGQAYRWRRDALRVCRDDPGLAAYWALNTGAPNDEIIATFMLLFG